MSPVVLKFHEGRISAVAMPAPGIVTISSSLLCAYSRTETPDIFDVKSCQAEIVVTGATRLETVLALNVALEVSDGTITIDEAPSRPAARHSSGSSSRA